MTGAELYADLRRRGQVFVSVDDKGAIAGARRLAKVDGFAVSQGRFIARSMTANQRRNAPYSVTLTAMGSDLVVAPDAAFAVSGEEQDRG